jgi:hypothetical protein
MTKPAISAAERTSSRSHDDVGTHSPATRPVQTSLSVDFIRGFTSDAGATVLFACLREANPAWRDFFDAQMARRLYDTPALRTEFLTAIVEMQDVQLAEKVLRTFLGQLDPKERRQVFGFESYRVGMSAFHTAVLHAHRQGITLAQAAPTAERPRFNPAASELMIRIGIEVKTKITQPVKYKTVLGHTDKVSPLVSAMIERNAGAMQAYLHLNHPIGRLEICKMLNETATGSPFSAELLDVMVGAVDRSAVMEIVNELWAKRPGQNPMPAFDAARARAAMTRARDSLSKPRNP